MIDKKINISLESAKVIANEKYVINTPKDINSLTILLNKQKSMYLLIDKDIVNKKLTKLNLLGIRGLFESIDGYLMLANMSGVIGINKVRDLSHIDIVLEMFMEECIIHIDLTK